MIRSHLGNDSEIGELAESLQRASTTMSGRPQARAKNVLIVDPDFRSARRLADLLNEDGFAVELARDGAAAMTRLSHPPLPAVLLTELTVPLAGGAAIARFGRSVDPTLSVIVLTRHPNLFAPHSFGSVAPAVLTKPLDYARLLDLLNGVEATTGGSETGDALGTSSPRF